jgi:hypothetical protein
MVEMDGFHPGDINPQQNALGYAQYFIEGQQPWYSSVEPDRPKPNIHIPEPTL